jgi:hypothetical protein
MPAVTIKIRRGTSTQWASSTKPLALAELGLDTTLNKIKAGNGTSLWPALPFLSVIPSEITELAQDAIDTALIAGTGITKTYNDNANTITLTVDSTVASKLYVDAAIAALDGTVSTGYIPMSLFGNPEGVATLDEFSKIPDSQIPATIARDSEVSTAITTEITNRNTAISTAIANLVDSSPATLNTLKELATAINNDASYAATITTALGTKAPIASPTFTGTVSGITKSMVGLENVDNTADSVKPISTAAQTALDNKVSVNLPSVDYYVTNSGAGGYLINGVLNGTIDFIKGKRYRIFVNATNHPFWIQTVPGGYSLANVYSSGVTNAGADNGSIIVELPQDAPNNLYYACQYHPSMSGSISVQSEDAITIISKDSSYTILPIDLGRLIEMSAGGTLTITDSASFPIGYSVDVLQTGTSQVTIAGDGFTPNSTPGLKLRAQWSSATLIKRALNSWVILGDLSA